MDDQEAVIKKFTTIKDLKILIVSVLDGCVPKLGLIPKTALIMKVQEILQDGETIADHYTVASVVDLLAYEEGIVIEEGARAKQYCCLPRHLRGRK